MNKNIPFIGRYLKFLGDKITFQYGKGLRLEGSIKRLFDLLKIKIFIFSVNVPLGV